MSPLYSRLLSIYVPIPSPPHKACPAPYLVISQCHN